MFGLKVHKHRECLLTLLKDGDEGNHILWDGRLKLKGCRSWIGDVDYDEAGQACQNLNGLRKIAPLWAFKIKNDWQETLIPKCVPQRVKNGFSILRKATEDQHRFRGDRVDHITNLLVVKKQVDELGDLDVVDG